MTAFKIGDRVRFTANYTRLKGAIGTIRHCDETGLWGVEFVKFNSGHTLDGRLSKDSGWYCGGDEIERVFEDGSRVRVTNGTRKGEEGKIIEDDKSNILPLFIEGVTGDTFWSDLANVEPIPPGKFAIGDRVVFTDKVPSLWWFNPGQTGKIVTAPSFGFRYSVEVDGVDMSRPGSRYAHVDDEHIAPAPVPVAEAAICIVAVTRNGRPAPSLRPYVHADRAAALREAERLAGLHKGDEFAVYERVASKRIEKSKEDVLPAAFDVPKALQALSGNTSALGEAFAWPSTPQGREFWLREFGAAKLSAEAKDQLIKWITMAVASTEQKSAA